MKKVHDTVKKQTLIEIIPISNVMSLLLVVFVISSLMTGIHLVKKSLLRLKVSSSETIRIAVNKSKV